MISLELEGVEIDNCVRCGGIWLDAGELEILFKNTAKKDAFLSTFEKSSLSRADRKCPICSKMMDKILVREGLFIDECSKKHGLWLDSGELEALLKLGGFSNDGGLSVLLESLFVQRSLTKGETKP